jgi:ADP-ribose pyrophosphatase YjhB (NUDIX family)
MKDASYRSAIRKIVDAIGPCDDLEADHRIDVLAWIDSDAPLCRIAPPAMPPKHLVAYFLVVDPERRRALLVDHRKACLWLPSGGHVEPGEHPAETVHREIAEELRLEGEFLFPEPIFLTVTETVGSTAGHVDVSLWYVVRGDAAVIPWFAPEEFVAAAWFGFGDLPLERCEPHLGRCVAKLERMLPAGREAAS